MLFMYGEVFDHDQLNDATHEAIARDVRRRQHDDIQAYHEDTSHRPCVDADGEERYLPHVDRLRLPIAFIHGAQNRLFLPEGSEATFKFLRRRTAPSTTSDT